MDDIRALVRNYVTSAGDKRYDDLANLVAESATFDGTVKNQASGRDGFVNGFRNLGPITVRHEIREIVVDGNRAAVMYELVTDTSVGNVLCCEFITTNGEQVTASTLIFDWRRWPEILHEIGRRAGSQH